MKAEINRLIDPPPADPRLPAAKTPTAIRAGIGLERKQAGSVNSEEVTVESTDGLFTFTVLVVKA